MKKMRIFIDGMTCQHCVKRVTVALESIGIKEADVEIGEAVISFDESKIDIAKIADVLQQSGYKLKNWQDL